MLLNIYFYFFVKPRVLVDIKKLCEYSHNEYPTDMNMGTRQIFIQRVGYMRAITHTLPVSLTSLVTNHHQFNFNLPNKI